MTPPKHPTSHHQRSLARILQEYGYEMIGFHLKSEYEYQIELWKSHAALIAAAQLQAYQDACARTLGSAAATHAARRSSFLALGRCAGPALAWIAAAPTAGSVPVPTQALLTRHFGDIADIVTAVNTAIDFSPNHYQHSVNLAFLAQGDPLGLPFKLCRFMDAERDIRSNTFLDAAHNILHNHQFSRFFLNKLHKAQPHSRSWPSRQQESSARRLIRDWIDSLRAWMYSHWTYFGSDPRPQSLQLLTDQLPGLHSIPRQWVTIETVHKQKES
ncbi:MAG: hypothetical protein JNK48_01405 [Bryobacterales bacterium]|nr:hypothetical protein [Bryobacterales bacterium]